MMRIHKNIELKKKRIENKKIHVHEVKSRSSIFNSSHKYVDDQKLNSWYIANIQFEDYTSSVLTIILEQGKTKFKLKPAFLT